MVTALYLAHLNPVTNAHTQIIRSLAVQADRVKVMPVVFRQDGTEMNSRSFPFSFDIRKQMIRSVIDDPCVDVSDDYAFEAPFKRYMPPLLSGRSWSLRRSILHGVEKDYFSYTGDRAEGMMLRLYRLHPRVGRRLPLSGTSVKAGMYRAAVGDNTDWRQDVPRGVADIIDGRWDIVKRFAGAADDTIKVLGMKFPRGGW